MLRKDHGVSHGGAERDAGLTAEHSRLDRRLMLNAILI